MQQGSNSRQVEKASILKVENSEFCQGLNVNYEIEIKDDSKAIKIEEQKE